MRAIIGVFLSVIDNQLVESKLQRTAVALLCARPSFMGRLGIYSLVVARIELIEWDCPGGPTWAAHALFRAQRQTSIAVSHADHNFVSFWVAHLLCKSAHFVCTSAPMVGIAGEVLAHVVDRSIRGDARRRLITPNRIRQRRRSLSARRCAALFV
jgi:hypothetical protein